MGDWRRVQVIGSCAAEEVPALREALDPGLDYHNFHCLVCGGIAGLPNWAGESINAVGNLAERNYDERAVAKTLEQLAKKAPSLAVKVHVGEAYEEDTCVATVVLEQGAVTINPPEIGAIPQQSDGQMESNFMNALRLAEQRRLKLVEEFEKDKREKGNGETA